MIRDLEQTARTTNYPKRMVPALHLGRQRQDPYMHGHGDRVACVAVRLAEELGCGAEVRKTVYLAGLLHNVGKIAIDENKLFRKNRAALGG